MGEIVLGGRYVIENEIGMGGMAIVYKGKDKMLNRTVAIKVLRPEFKQDEEFIKRFDIEAKSAAGLNHQNIVSIYDVGIHDGLRYIVMEYIDGITLKDYISKNGKIPWRKALKFSAQICSALTHAHAGKIIHRDIKPHNIMVTGDGSLKVMDFGIARATSASTLTIGSKVLGSAHYLSPEQARGGFTDERSDLYSLGVCMYEMVTGVLPFDAETTVAVAMQHLQKDPERPGVHTEDLPENVEYIILKAMRKEQSQRYSSAKHMESDILRVMADPFAELNDDDNENFYSTKRMDVVDPDNEIDSENDKRKKVKKKGGGKFVILALFLFISMGIAVSFLAYMFKDKGNDVILVPDIKNLTLEQAEEKLKALDENAVVIVKRRSFSDKNEKDKIIIQEPEEGRNMPGTKEIYVVIGLGEEAFEVESYVGDKLTEVKNKITDAGLLCRVEDEEDDDLSERYEEGRVTSQDPSPGTIMRVGETITVYVSIGAENVKPKIPDVTGMYADEAETVLREAGYHNVKFEEKESSEEKDIVLIQEPEGESRVDKEEKIVLTVAIPEKKAPVQPEENEDEETETVKYTNITFSVPDGEKNVVVKVVEKNNRTSVYKNEHSPGDTVTLKVPADGDAVYEIYIDDAYYKEKRVQG